MSYLPIALGVRRKPDTSEAVFANRSRYRSLMEKTLWRDDHTCRCCGFQSQKYQRIVPADPDHDAGDAFITVCLFCDNCFSLERTGLSGGGVLIWLPEMSQADLNHVLRAIYVARDTEGHPLAEAAQKALDALLSRRTEAKKRLGTDDPLLLATVFFEELNDREYAARAAKLDGVRLLSLDKWLVRGKSGDVDHFPQIVKYWRSPQGPFGKIAPGSWKALFESVASKAGRTH